jgi:hypothetical protein
MQNSVALLLRALLLWIGGRVHFRRDLENVKAEDRGERFHAFRMVTVEPTAEQPAQPGATFRVRFAFKSLSATANRRLSLIPVPLIVAQPGFRAKTWLLGQQTGDFIGHYEFDTVEAAEAYWDSLPLRMMRRRAAPGSLTHEVSATGKKEEQGL